MILRPRLEGDLHRQSQDNHVAILPLAINHSVGKRLRFERDTLAVDSRRRFCAPARNAQMKRKLYWLRRRDFQRDGVAERIIRFFGNLHRRAVADFGGDFAGCVERRAQALVGRREPEFLRVVRPAV